MFKASTFERIQDEGFRETKIFLGNGGYEKQVGNFSVSKKICFGPTKRN